MEATLAAGNKHACIWDVDAWSLQVPHHVTHIYIGVCTWRCVLNDNLGGVSFISHQEVLCRTSLVFPRIETVGAKSFGPIYL